MASKDNSIELVNSFLQKHSDKHEFDFTLKKVGNKIVCGFTPVGGHMNSEWWVWSYQGRTFEEAIKGAIRLAEVNIEKFNR